jgi:segregation and condensation protein B
MEWKTHADWRRVSRAVRFAHPLMRSVAESRKTVRGPRFAPPIPPEVAPPPGEFARSVEMARLEAILWAAGEPLTGRKLAQFTPLADGTQARTLIRQLNQFYDRAGTAFRVEEVAGGFQLLTRPKFSKWLGRLFPTPVELRLSGPAMETLAIIAYRQPVPRAEIEAIRGVQCGEMLRQLLERDFIRIGGRADELGRPFLYTTTRHFLQTFGLRRLEELPRAEFLRPSKPAAPDGGPAGSEVRDNESTLRNAVHEEPEVTIADFEKYGQDLGISLAETPWGEAGDFHGPGTAVAPRAEDDDDDFEDDDDLDDDDDDEDDDLDDEEDDDWEEVDDEDDDLDEEDDEDEDDDDDDWDDDDDDDWDDDEEVEEEEDDEE